MSPAQDHGQGQDFPDGIVSEFNRRKTQNNLGLAMNEPVCIGENGRYVLREIVGFGGIGTVFEASDAKVNNRPVAVKVLNTQKIHSASRGVLLREADILSRFSHDNILNILDLGRAAGSEHFIVTEYIDGVTLRTWQAEQRERGHMDRIIEVYREAGRGLAAAHRGGVLHRDFKPDNVFVTRDGSRVKVGDWGLARGLGAQLSTEKQHASATSRSGAENQTTLGTRSGTRGYMAPEVGRQEPDVRADLYSYCVSLWEALTGELPFGCRSHEPSDTLPIRPSKMPRWLYPELRKGLAYARGDRHGEVQIFLDALDSGERAVLRRGRAATLVGVVGLTASVVVGLLAVQRARACDGVGEDIVDVWNDSTRRSVEDAIMSIDSPTAKTAARYAIQTFDRATRQWTHASRQLCDQHERGEIGEPDYRTSKGCLGRTRRAIEDRIEVLTLGEPEDLERIDEILGPLRQSELCADPPPLLEVRVDQLIERSRLEQQRARYEDAHTVAEAAFVAAQASNRRCRDGESYSHELAAAWARLGEARARLRRFEPGLSAFEESRRHAEACADDDVYMDGQIYVARILAGYMNQVDGALEALDNVALRRIRIGRRLRVDSQAELEKARAKIALLDEDYARARAHYEAGLAALESDASNEDHFSLAVELQFNVAVTHINEGSPEQARLALEQLRARSDQYFDEPGFGDTLERRLLMIELNLGLIELQSGDFDGARRRFEPLEQSRWDDLRNKGRAALLAALMQVAEDEQLPEVHARALALRDGLEDVPESDERTVAEMHMVAGQALLFVDDGAGFEELEKAYDMFVALRDMDNASRSIVSIAEQYCYLEDYARCETAVERLGLELAPDVRERARQLQNELDEAKRSVGSPD